jgi:uncharacterized protein (DUF1330 family)
MYPYKLWFKTKLATAQAMEAKMVQFVVGHLKSLKDTAKMDEYRKVAADALAKHGGTIVVPPTKPERIEGDAEAPQAIVLLSFPSAAAARAWRDDPSLAEIHGLRHAGADISFFLIETGT